MDYAAGLAQYASPALTQIELARDNEGGRRKAGVRRDAQKRSNQQNDSSEKCGFIAGPAARAARILLTGPGCGDNRSGPMRRQARYPLRRGPASGTKEAFGRPARRQRDVYAGSAGVIVPAVGVSGIFLAIGRRRRFAMRFAMGFAGLCLDTDVPAGAPTQERTLRESRH